jgi:hypothetical protein
VPAPPAGGGDTRPPPHEGGPFPAAGESPGGDYWYWM